MRGAQRPGGEGPWCPPRPYQRGLRPVVETKTNQLIQNNNPDKVIQNNNTHTTTTATLSYNERGATSSRRRSLVSSEALPERTPPCKRGKTNEY